MSINDRVAGGARNNALYGFVKIGIKKIPTSLSFSRKKNYRNIRPAVRLARLAGFFSAFRTICLPRPQAREGCSLARSIPGRELRSKSGRRGGQR